MNIRDLKPSQLRSVAIECDSEYDRWYKNTGGKEFGTGKLLDTKEIWRYAWSKAVSTILRRVDQIKE